MTLESKQRFLQNFYLVVNVVTSHCPLRNNGKKRLSVELSSQSACKQIGRDQIHESMLALFSESNTYIVSSLNHEQMTL